MVGLKADLMGAGSDIFNAAVKERQLDLRGSDISSIEYLRDIEDQFDMIDLSDNHIVKLENFPYLNHLGTLVVSNNRINHISPNIGELLPKIHTLVLMNNRLTSLVEIDPLASLPKLQSLNLQDNAVTEQPDYRLYVIQKLKHLLSLDFKKVKQQERTEATQKFQSKEVEKEVKKKCAKAYTPMQVVDAQYITEEPGPKVFAPRPGKTTAIKAAIVSSQTLQEIARIKTALSTGQIAAEFAFLNPEIDMAEALDKTDKMKTEGQNHENGADEQTQNEESAPIQEVKVSICNSCMIEIDQEIFGAGPDSKYVTLPGHIDIYIYKNFQRTLFRFIFSWRKKLFKGMHILPLPRMQLLAHTWTLNYTIYDIPPRLCAYCEKHSH